MNRLDIFKLGSFFFLNLLSISIIHHLSTLPANAQSQSPVEIRAEKFELDLKNLTSHFSKNVVINFFPYQAHCQQAQVFLSNTQKVVKVIMSGNVTIQRGNSIFRGKTIILDVVRNKLEVQGQVYTRLDPAEFKSNLR